MTKYVCDHAGKFKECFRVLAHGDICKGTHAHDCDHLHRLPIPCGDVEPFVDVRCIPVEAPNETE